MPKLSSLTVSKFCFRVVYRYSSILRKRGIFKEAFEFGDFDEFASANTKHDHHSNKIITTRSGYSP